MKLVLTAEEQVEAVGRIDDDYSSTRVAIGAAWRVDRLAAALVDELSRVDPRPSTGARRKPPGTDSPEALLKLGGGRLPPEPPPPPPPGAAVQRLLLPVARRTATAGEVLLRRLSGSEWRKSSAPAA